MKKVLFIVNHRKDRSPGQRFRFEQYITYLEQNGFKTYFSILLNEKDDRIFYSKKNYLKKLWIFLKANRIRLRDWFRAGSFDIIFIFREAMMTGSTFFERKFKKSGARIIFDFDDSIWLQTVSDSNKKLGFLKNAGKTKFLIELANLVIAGNPFLADYALPFNKQVVIIPTTIDTEMYTVREPGNTGRIVIGWSGSFSTIPHFEFALEALIRIRKKYGNAVEFLVIGDAGYSNDQLGIKGMAWNYETEITDLHRMDIGIMPLPDDEWARGKCGLKGLQYMACGIPTIMSPVGVNTEIIKDGENGFLANDNNEWTEKLSILIENAELRKQFALKGRETVEEKYSVQANKEKYLKAFRKVLQA